MAYHTKIGDSKGVFLVFLRLPRRIVFEGENIGGSHEKQIVPLLLKEVRKIFQ
jgi:hypothetical protein